MTPETIRKQFRGPHSKEVGSMPQFRWYEKGRHWPRTMYMLFFNSESREFRLHRGLQQCQQRRAPFELLTEPALVEAFRSCLSPADLAKCTAASIVGVGRQSRLWGIAPGGRLSTLNANNQWEPLGSTNPGGR